MSIRSRCCDASLGRNPRFGDNDEPSPEENIMTETNSPSGDPRKRSDESFGWSGGEGAEGGKSAAGREWVGQLQSMIDNLATTAAPVLREIGAKAAELAALAGEKAGPIAHRAADATATAGSKVAERGRVVAADLRRDAGRDGDSDTTGGTSTGGTSTGSSTTGTYSSGTGSTGARPGPGAESRPFNDRPGGTADSADSLGE
jgi:hypothetical protein